MSKSEGREGQIYSKVLNICTNISIAISSLVLPTIKVKGRSIPQNLFQKKILKNRGSSGWFVNPYEDVVCTSFVNFPVLL